MQLYYIRHAQSQNNALYDQSGSYSGRNEDPELTPLGLQQAQLLAQFLAGRQNGGAPDGGDLQNGRGFGLTHLYTSPMVRAAQTGTLVSQALGLPLEAWPDLHEGGGIFLDDPVTGVPTGLPGKNRFELQARFPDLRLPESIGEAGWWSKPFEGRPERRARAQRVLSGLLERHGATDHRVAFFSHGGFYNHLIAALTGLSDREEQVSEEARLAMNAENLLFGPGVSIWFSLNNTAITRIDFTPSEVKLVYQNRLDFLPSDLIT